MRHVDHGRAVHFYNDVVHFQTTIDGSRTSGYQLSNVDIGFISDMRIIGTACDAETQAGSTFFERHFFEVPFRRASVYLQINDKILINLPSIKNS